jgi:hypothetical protein
MKLLHKRLWFAALILLCVGVLIAAAYAQDSLADADTVVVDTEAVIGPYNRFVYGANQGPTFTLNPDNFGAVRDAGVSFLRFPAGNWGDRNNIRPEMIDFFMIQCRAVGAEPSIHVRLRDGTPEAAAELVRYANIEKDYNIRYWYIGNEPNLFPEYSLERFNEEWRVWAEAMRAVDPDIILIGPEVSQYPPDDPGDEYHRWVREFLEVNGDLVDIVSIHRYPFPQGQQQTTVEAMRANPPEWERIIPHLRELIRETTGRDLPVAVTEVNSHWANVTGGEAGMDSLYNAIWWGDVLGRLIRQQVEIVALFTLSTDGNEGSWGMMGKYEMRPTYYVYPMYQRLGETLVEAVTGHPDLSAVAALRDDGALTLILINRGPDALDQTLALNGFVAGGEAEVWRFDADHNAEQIESQAIADGAAVTLPGQSMTLYIIPPG